MTKERETLKLALAVLKEWRKGFPDDWTDFDTEAINAIREALAQPEQEPVATNQQIIEWANRHDFKGTLTDLRCAFEDAQTVCATPPSNSMNSIKSSNTLDAHRKPLSDEEITRIGAERQGLHQVARAIEAAHGIKG